MLRIANTAWLLFTLSGCHFTEGTERHIPKENMAWQGFNQLTGDQIESAFADVIDHAIVLDGVGGSALNYWYKEGRFESNWSVAAQSGQLSGTWYVNNGLRCVVLDQGVVEMAANEPRCGPIYVKDGKYYSANVSGGIHGIHELKPLDFSHESDD